MPLLAHIAHRLMPVVSPERMVVVTNDPTLAQSLRLPLPATFILDAYPNTGTLGGIATGLRAVDGWALVVATDLPLVSAPLCAWLASLTTRDTGDAGFDVIMPVVGGYEEPLHALYHRRCLSSIEARLARGERRVISFLPDVRVRYVAETELRAHDPDLRSFVNANTPDEWQHALELLRAS
jgi:molybdopterin-guanine dinucleotide biosynthesis protein A